MVLSDVGLLAVDSMRTRAYLSALASRGMAPAEAILMGPGGGPSPQERSELFDNTTPALEAVRRAGVPHRVLQERDVNSASVIAAVRESPTSVFIYSGPAGGILREEILSSGKRFLHVHAGLLPRYRGSTTAYYSLLEEGECGASALFLDRRIDGGAVLATKRYPAPRDRRTIDYEYDPYLRSDLLADVLGRHAATGRWGESPQAESESRTYFIIHPVLKHIAILGSDLAR
jgi:methionyl-tRNA formyltransferase